MDGVTDFLHRELVTSLGGVSLCVTEFVRVTSGAVPARVLLRDAPELSRGGTTTSGVPVFVQLLGGDPAAMAASARVAARLGAPGIDINFGCPAKRVNSHDGGASILRCPERAEHITRAVRDAVPAEIPVSVKIRLGWADSTCVEELAQRIERGGASWLTIHARTKQQMYMPPVDHAAVGRARASVSMPVVANGDIASRDDLERCRALSAAHGFMLGRASLSNPFLFRELRGAEIPGDFRAAYVELLERYVSMMLAASHNEAQALCRLKQWLGLGKSLAPGLCAMFDTVKVCSSLSDAFVALSTTPAPIAA
jgi:tRNA-dihydrouridine synthase C